MIISSGIFGALILISFVMIVWGLVLIGVVNDCIDTYEKLEETQEIVGIQDNSQVTGSGNVFYAYISTEGVYTFYYKVDDGYRQGKVSTDDTIIYEDDNCNPSVQRYESYTRNNWSEKWTKILLFSTMQNKQVLDSTRYEIHVPKGTIVRDFTLDAEH